MKVLFYSLGFAFFGLCSIGWSQAPNLEAMDIVTKSIPDGPVARVRDTNIAKIDFLLLYRSELNSYRRDNPSKPLTDQQRVRIGLLCLNMLLEEELLYQEAVILKFEIEDDALKKKSDAEIEQIRKAFSLQVKREVTESEVIKQLGYENRADVVNEVKRKMLIDKMREHIVAERFEAIPEETILATYETNKAQMIVPMRLHLKHISIRSNKNDEPGRKAGLAKANKALDRIYSGQRFETVAQEYSELLDPENGCDLGMLPVNILPPFMVKATVGMEVDDISDLIETNTGVHILTLVAREESGPIDQDEAMEMLRRRLSEDKKRLLVREYCDPLIRSGAARVFLELKENFARITGIMSLKAE